MKTKISSKTEVNKPSQNFDAFLTLSQKQKEPRYVQVVMQSWKRSECGNTCTEKPFWYETF